MTKIGCLVFFVLFSFSFAQTNYVDYLIQAAQLNSEKKYDQAISIFQQILQSNPPAWAQVGAYYGLFSNYVMKNQVDLALNALEKGIQAGMNDYIAIHDEPAYRALFQNPRFIQLYQQMRISPADARELYWIYSEFLATNHETTMLITANMGRKDSDYTEVFQVEIPTRVPQSATILLGREYIRYLQTLQKNQVLQSDISRLNHLMQMNIINNMPSGGNDDPNASYWKEQQKQQAIEDSRRQARVSAEQRKAAIMARRFVLPPGTSTVPEACPALGSLGTRGQNNTAETQTPVNNTPPTNTQTATSEDALTQQVIQGLQPLTVLCGTWQGEGSDQDGNFQAQIKVRPVVQNTYLQFEFHIRYISGAKSGAESSPIILMTYNPNTAQYLWAHFYSPGATLNLVGKLSLDQKNIQFQFADGRSVYSFWSFSSSQFEAVLQVQQNGQMVIFGKENYRKTSNSY